MPFPWTLFLSRFYYTFSLTSPRYIKLTKLHLMDTEFCCFKQFSFKSTFSFWKLGDFFLPIEAVLLSCHFYEHCWLAYFFWRWIKKFLSFRHALLLTFLLIGYSKPVKMIRYKLSYVNSPRLSLTKSQHKRYSFIPMTVRMFAGLGDTSFCWHPA